MNLAPHQPSAAWPALIGPHHAPHGQDAGIPLPGWLLSKMQGFFNTDLSHVRIHMDSAQALALGVYAFASGHHIHFAPGWFDPFSHKGLQMLGHELTHVLQQQCGRATAAHTMGMVLDDRALEVEADLMGEHAARFHGDGSARMWVDRSGRFFAALHADIGFDDYAHFRRWFNDQQGEGEVIQAVLNMPAWWSAAVAANVENFVAGRVAPIPGMLSLYHGTTPGFLNQVTGFNGNEQAWVNNFFQWDVGATTHCGPGIYGADSLGGAQGYGASIMRVIPSTLARTRYVDITGAGHYQGTGVTAQDVRRFAYRCILRFTANYYAVKDHRVEWEPL